MAGAAGVFTVEGEADSTAVMAEEGDSIPEVAVDSTAGPRRRPQVPALRSRDSVRPCVLAVHPRVLVVDRSLRLVAASRGRVEPPLARAGCKEAEIRLRRPQRSLTVVGTHSVGRQEAVDLRGRNRQLGRAPLKVEVSTRLARIARLAQLG